MLTLLPFIFFVVIIVTAVAEKINIPYPLLLVITGLIAGFVPHPHMWHPRPNAVLAVFLPPILFSASRLISGHELKAHLFKTIVSLSFVLVILSMVGVACVLYYYIPTMPMSAALALGAIISPTDTVAACSIMQRLHVQQHIIQTVEMESLFNDAAGIVLFKMAMVYVSLDSITHAMITTHAAWLIIGGIGTGLIVAYFSSIIIENFLINSKNELPIIMSIVMAYVAYLLADHINASSVLAVVSAGLFHRRTESLISAQTRLTETSVWETLLFFLNGIIFVAIGIQFPASLSVMKTIPTHTLIMASILTIVTLLVLRFVWIAIINYCEYLFKKRTSAMTLHALMQKVVVVSWSGMRGLVSLALALSLPIATYNETPFPYRQLVIYLTFVTILFTLVVQGLTLPWVIRKMKANKNNQAELFLIETIYERLTAKAMRRMKNNHHYHDLYTSPAKKLVNNYYVNRQSRIEIAFQQKTHDAEATLNIIKEARQLLTHILTFERTMLSKLRHRGDITEDIFIKLLSKLDRDEVGFESFH